MAQLGVQMKSPPVDRDAEAIAREFGEYAYCVSHDLSAPVRAMVQFSELLGGECSNGLSVDSREYLDIIIQNGRKLQTMMQGLLDFSRLNTMAKPFSPVDCNKILKQSMVVLNLGNAAGEEVVRTSWLPTVKADADQMMQLFTCLLDNALKFQPPKQKPLVEVSAARLDGMWRFVMRDNGIGISAQFQDRVFQLFRRLHTDEEYPGVGVGLTLAQKIVQRHGGAIWCESEPGQGASFCFTLPAAEQAA